MVEQRCQRCKDIYKDVQTDDVLLPEYMRKFVNILRCTTCDVGKFDHMLPTGSRDTRRCNLYPKVNKTPISAPLKISAEMTKMSMIAAVRGLDLQKQDAQRFIHEINAIQSQEDADRALCKMRIMESESKFMENMCVLKFRARNHDIDALRESARLALIEIIGCEEKTRTMDLFEVASLCYSMRHQLLLDEHWSRLVYRIREGAEIPLIEFSARIFAQQVIKEQSGTVAAYVAASKLVLSGPAHSSNRTALRQMYLLSLCKLCVTRPCELALHCIATNVIESSKNPTPESLSVLTTACQLTLERREMPKILNEGEMMTEADSEAKFRKHEKNLLIMKHKLRMELIALESATFPQMVPLLTCAVKGLMGPHGKERNGL